MVDVGLCFGMLLTTVRVESSCLALSLLLLELAAYLFSLTFTLSLLFEPLFLG